jgi:hypothetical protein
MYDPVCHFLAENVLHCRRNIDVVMDDFPGPGLSMIDVRNAILDGDLLSSKLELPILDAHFVTHIPEDLDELIFQFNLPVRGQFGYLLKRSPDRIPANFPTAVGCMVVTTALCDQMSDSEPAFPLTMRFNAA